MRGSCYLVHGLINAEPLQTLAVGGHWGEERGSGARWCQFSLFLVLSCSLDIMRAHRPVHDVSHMSRSFRNCAALHITPCVTWAHCHEECDTASHITSHTPKHHCVTQRDREHDMSWHRLTVSQDHRVYRCTALVYLCHPWCTPVQSQAAPGLWSSHTSRSVGSGQQRLTQVWHQTWSEGTLLQNTNNY